MEPGTDIVTVGDGVVATGVSVAVAGVGVVVAETTVGDCPTTLVTSGWVTAAFVHERARIVRTSMKIRTVFILHSFCACWLVVL